MRIINHLLKSLMREMRTISRHWKRSLHLHLIRKKVLEKRAHRNLQRNLRNKSQFKNYKHFRRKSPHQENPWFLKNHPSLRSNWRISLAHLRVDSPYSHPKQVSHQRKKSSKKRISKRTSIKHSVLLDPVKSLSNKSSSSYHQKSCTPRPRRWSSKSSHHQSRLIENLDMPKSNKHPRKI